MAARTPADPRAATERTLRFQGFGADGDTVSFAEYRESGEGENRVVEGIAMVVLTKDAWVKQHGAEQEITISIG